MKYRVEVWAYPTDEEGGEHKLQESKEFAGMCQAMDWLWQRLEEGFAVRLYRI